MVLDGPSQRLFDADIQLGVESFQTDGSHTGHILLHHGVVNLASLNGFHQVETVEAVAFHDVDGIAYLVGEVLQQLDLVAALGQVDGLASQVDRRAKQLVLHLVGRRHLVPVFGQALHKHALLHQDGICQQVAPFHVLVGTDAHCHHVDTTRVKEGETRVQVFVDNHLKFQSVGIAEIAKQLILKARRRRFFSIVIDYFTIGYSDQSSSFLNVLQYRQRVLFHDRLFFRLRVVVTRHQPSKRE